MRLRSGVLVLVTALASIRNSEDSVRAAAPRLRSAPRTAATCTVPAFGNGEPYPATTPGDNFIPRSALAVADFNQDEHLDLAITDLYDVSILLGDGAGRLGPRSVVTVGGDLRALAAADFNGDGRADIAVALTDAGAGQIKVLLRSAAGAFTVSGAFDAGPEPSALVAADFDHDGAVDLAVPNGPTLTVSILRGNGVGGFLPRTVVELPRAPTTLAAADLNGDGHADLAVPTDDLAAEASLEVLLGDGTGGFAPPVSSPLGHYPRSITAGDLDSDGRPDLIVTHVESGDFPQGSVSVLLGEGNGVFGVSTTLAMPHWTLSASVGEFNGDGLLDLAIAHIFSRPDQTDIPSFQVMLGDGHGGFGPARSFSNMGISIGPASVGDFDEDGRLDLVTSDGRDNASLFLNYCGNQADVTVTISDEPDPAPLGRYFVYTVTVTNNGPDPAGVKLVLAMPPGMQIISPIQPSHGYCDWDAPFTLGCHLGNLAGAAPGNTVTVTWWVSTPALGPVMTTATVTSTVVETDVSNDSETEATLIQTLGGSGVTIGTAPGGGTSLNWFAGEWEAGYFVGRWTAGVSTVFPANGVPLPHGTSSFVDPSPVPGQANCYTVVAVDSSGLTWTASYWLCRVPGLATPSGAPTSFTARMDLPQVRFTWSGPGGQTQYLLVTYFLSNPGFPPRGTLFDGASTEGSVSSGSATNCFVLVPLDGATHMGHSDALCVVPTQGSTP